MDQLIRQERTGSPKSLASKLQISESHVYNCIDELKDLGLPIIYCRTRQTYYYEDKVQLNISFSIVNLTTKETIEIGGGTIIISFLAHSNMIGVNRFTFIGHSNKWPL
jgi:biotin operon repressor